MKGVLRTAWLLYTGYGLQRWLGGIGTALLLAGAASLRLELLSPILLVIGLACVLLTPFVAGGLLFRDMASPRIHRLIPHARLQLTAGALLAVLVGALLFSTVAIITPWSQPMPIGFTTLLARSMLAGTVALLGMFAGTSSVLTMTLWFCLLGFSPVLVPALSRVEGVAAFAGNDVHLWITLAALWLGFWLWYRQVQSIRWINITATEPQGTLVGAIDTSRHAVLTTLLLGPRAFSQMLVSGLFAVFFLVLAPYLMSRWSTGDWKPPALADVIPASVILLLFAGIGAWTIGRRARLLWLAGGYSRRELFSICESRAWQQYWAMAVYVPPLLVIALSGDAVRIGALFAATLTGGACLLYFGLRRVRPWSAGDVLLAAAYTCACVFWLACINNAVSSTLLITAGAVVQLPLVFLMRAAAIRRWQRIDWVIHKRLSMPSSAARSAT